MSRKSKLHETNWAQNRWKVNLAENGKKFGTWVHKGASNGGRSQIGISYSNIFSSSALLLEISSSRDLGALLPMKKSSALD